MREVAPATSVLGRSGAPDSAASWGREDGEEDSTADLRTGRGRRSGGGGRVAPRSPPPYRGDGGFEGVDARSSREAARRVRRGTAT
ncbi:hypothetical protein E2562_028319 [Oryza meyeriana var. granulata]|uniref:Uncharacterized protein n=1 Tax=Oryza meyeriana var. granulata TaxID=110450 RepID=A0A6G1CU57_9ORYZ|nr:hypothetical protein E2562_030487 [Oryza meyeriana var. granulata]KAF0934723.1 hypothetical protein E2562_028319 [Oryza meyeriana var. granulata]